MKKKDLSISMLSANILSLAFALPAAVLYILLFSLLWDAARFDAGVHVFMNNILIFMAVFIAGILAHELIHAAAWSLFARLPFKTIRFGFQIQTLTPYAHCPGPVPAAVYRLGALMPALLLGLLPALIALLSGSGWLLDAGDAYFDAREIKLPTRKCGPGPALFQLMVTTERGKRRDNQDRLRALHADRPEIDIFCGHNPFEYLDLVERNGDQPRGISTTGNWKPQNRAVGAAAGDQLMTRR